MSDRDRAAGQDSSPTLRPILPHVFASAGEKPLPNDLVGAEILFMGSAFKQGDFDMGTTLVLDYRPKGGRKKRLLLQFTDTGMWIESRHRN